MQTPARLDAPSVPAPLAQQLHHDLRVYVARLDPPMSAGVGSYEIAQRDAPTGSDRLALTKRRDLIDGWLRPAGEAVAARFYAIFQATMAVPERPGPVAALHMRSWISDAAVMPEFALDKACAAARSGAIGDGKWMPEVGPVLIEARRHVAAFAKERREIDAVLNAKVVTGAKSRKTELLAIAAGLVKTMPLAGAKAEAERLGRTIDETVFEPPFEQRRAEGHDEFQARMLREAREAGSRPLPKMTGAHRRMLGLRDEPEDHRYGRFDDDGRADGAAA